MTKVEGYYSMRITRDVRDYAAKLEMANGNGADAVEAGIQEKAREFMETGGEIYR